MNPKAAIFFTPVFAQSTKQFIEFKSQWTDKEVTKRHIHNILASFKTQVLDNPLCYARVPELQDFGVISIRHAIFDDLRIIYDTEQHSNGTTTVEVLLLLSTKQSIQKQLIDYCLYSF